MSVPPVRNVSKQSDFAKHSAEIEGESETSGQIDAVETLEGFDNMTEKKILLLHSTCLREVDVDWKGKWRTCDVSVGGYDAPHCSEVPGLMKVYIDGFTGLDPWEAHNAFQEIHPFQDFNGRVGRLLWLYKALQEGYNYEISFLKKYYYQTLAHQ